MSFLSDSVSADHCFEKETMSQVLANQILALAAQPFAEVEWQRQRAEQLALEAELRSSRRLAAVAEVGRYISMGLGVVVALIGCLGIVLPGVKEFFWLNWIGLYALVLLGALLLNRFMPGIFPAAGVLRTWLLLYPVVGIPTLIWASYPGLGGGVTELAYWILVFGLLATGLLHVMLRIFPARSQFFDEGTIVIAGIIGYALGAAYFVVIHIAGTHPVTGDWWKAPAFSAAMLLLSGGAQLFVAPLFRRNSVHRKRAY